MSRVTGAEIPHETRVTHLGHNVTLPCDGSDQVVFQGGHASQLRRDGTNFVIIEAAPEDEGGILLSIMHILIFIVYCSGTYNCYSNNSLVSKVDLILKENVPFSESNSAQQNSEDNSDSDYLR